MNTHKKSIFITILMLICMSLISLTITAGGDDKDEEVSSNAVGTYSRAAWNLTRKAAPLMRDASPLLVSGLSSRISNQVMLTAPQVWQNHVVPRLSDHIVPRIPDACLTGLNSVCDKVATNLPESWDNDHVKATIHHKVLYPMLIAGGAYGAYYLIARNQLGIKNPNAIFSAENREKYKKAAYIVKPYAQVSWPLLISLYSTSLAQYTAQYYTKYAGEGWGGSTIIEKGLHPVLFCGGILGTVYLALRKAGIATLGDLKKLNAILLMHAGVATTSAKKAGRRIQSASRMSVGNSALAAQQRGSIAGIQTTINAGAQEILNAAQELIIALRNDGSTKINQQERELAQVSQEIASLGAIYGDLTQTMSVLVDGLTQRTESLKAAHAQQDSDHKAESEKFKKEFESKSRKLEELMKQNADTVSAFNPSLKKLTEILQLLRQQGGNHAARLNNAERTLREIRDSLNQMCVDLNSVTVALASIPGSTTPGDGMVLEDPTN